MIAVLGGACLAGAVVAPLAAALLSVVRAPKPGRAQQTTTRLGWLSALLALVAAALVGLGGPFLVAVGGRPGHVALGLWADQLTVTLVVLVCVVGAVVQSFSLRYLQGDLTARRFSAASSVVVAATAVVCSTATMTTLVVAWVIAGAAFVVALGCRQDLPGVQEATRRMRRMFAAGDLALMAALGLVWLRAGNVDLASRGALQAAALEMGRLSTPLAILVAVAALTRSAQGLFGRWLPGTVSAPTPASALLHAGVVNGGGVLLVRLGVLAGGSMLVMAGVFVVAGITAVVATQAMTRKSDVKGALVLSTMSQMGFMVAECAVGAYLAAVVHLIGHALYKATLFFGSGSQIPRPGQAPIAPDAVVSNLARTTAALATGVVTLGTMAAIPGVLAHRGAAVLLFFAAATVVTASWSWWGQPPVSARGTAVAMAALVAAGAAYGLVIGGLGDWIAPALPAPGPGVLSPGWQLSLAGIAIAATAAGRLPSLRWRLTAILVDAAAPAACSAPGALAAGHGGGAKLLGRAPSLDTSWQESAA
jgi:NADH:ubiquinone oxidoreductase subunit 5 (subunit L)/multisubunit Na+/H+ antiporter MnhA subunit